MDTVKLTQATTLYPDTDGQPMSESDATRDYLIYYEYSC
jgi:hypothetical protein